MAEQAQTLPASIQGLSAAELFDGDADVVERVLAEVEGAARSIVPDISTDKGRRAVASLAAKVARSKTFLDGLGKDHVAELKRRAGEVDAKRRTIRDRLDALKAEVRQPLTEYEQAEADRQAAIQARIDALGQMPPDDPFTDSETLAARIAELEAVEIGDDYAERADEARQVKAATLYELGRRLERVREREAAEAKAEAERQERERREREEREAEIARQAAERARREAEEKAAAEREAAERAVAESQARAERDAAEAKARAERAEHAAAQAAERERERIAAEQARERAEARRLADREHRGRINREVLADLCDLGLAEADAKHLIAAIARGQVAHVRIDY